jgi:excisionase family DNA binding protein
MRPHVETDTHSLTTDSRLVFTIAEAAKLLGISRSFAYELAKRGELHVVQLGRRQLVPKASLSKLLETHQTSFTSKAVE